MRVFGSVCYARICIYVWAVYVYVFVNVYLYMYMLCMCVLCMYLWTCVFAGTCVQVFAYMEASGFYPDGRGRIPGREWWQLLPRCALATGGSMKN